ncbi:MAG TPA: GntR family transcriptional regulator [Caulobacterales bacterium]|nr:GntR family transcriptional regulator [Caulobacterales bacterium]
MLAERIGGLNDNDHAPLYLQLQKALREAIQRRVLEPDETLPAERDIAEEFSVSRVTVRKALDGLVNEGLLSRRQGAGTWVASRVEKSFSKLTSFSEDMRARGRVPHSTWLSKTVGEVTPAESLMLGLSPGAGVYRFSRIRFADSTPMALEYSSIPAFCLPSPESVDVSLYEALDRQGYRPKRALQRLRAVLFTPEQAEALHVQPNGAGLLIERHGFLKDGRVVELTQSYYRGDAYDFVAELTES